MLPTGEAPELHDGGFASPVEQGPLNTLFRAGEGFTHLLRTIQYRDNAFKLSLFLRYSDARAEPGSLCPPASRLLPSFSVWCQ